MPTLNSISVAINTQSNSLVAVQNEPQPLPAGFFVFIKNRSNTSSTSDPNTTYVANDLAWQQYAASDPYDCNPYLGRADAIVLPPEPTSTQTVAINLRTKPIPFEELILPVINVHFLPGAITQAWMFNYTVSFAFDDRTYNYSFSSQMNGLTAIALDEHNRNYSGIGQEHPKTVIAPFSGPAMDSILTAVSLTIYTHKDDSGDNKDADTVLDVHIVNRTSSSTSQDLVVAKNLLAGREFPPNSINSVTFGDVLPLASPSIRLQDMVLPVVNIFITPNGNDTWRFDYAVQFTFNFEDHVAAQIFSSTTSGAVLNQNARTHSGVYQGDSFPTVKPVVAPLTGPAVPSHTKLIPLALLRNKLQEIINSRQGVTGDSLTPTIERIRIDHTAYPAGGLPASYYDVQSIDAAPPRPGTMLLPGYREPVTWTSSPTDLGPLSSSVLFGEEHPTYHLTDINSNSLTVVFDATQAPTPIIVTVGFETDGPNEVSGTDGTTSKFETFSIQLKLTLTLDPVGNSIDLMSWVPDLNPAKWTATPQPTNPPSPPEFLVTGTFLGQPVSVIAPSLDTVIKSLLERVLLVTLKTTSAWDPGGTIRQNIRDRIFSTLSDVNPFGMNSRENLNAMFNWVLLGGPVVGHRGAYPASNVCKVSDVHIDAANDNLLITYAGPQATFQFDTPADWPAGVDFNPGTLSNIDHIVVLTMENRSFDQMLGYLSLPPEKGGMGRTDIDGLKGNEINYINSNIPCPSVPFLTGETVFAPDPPHSFEPVQKAINGGKMDLFAQTYFDQSGPTVGPNIMKYHTGANLPVYDTLARDFAICHRWFCSHPGPTFCNRFHEISGKLKIDPMGFWELSNSSARPAFFETIFDSLDTRGVSWNYFEHLYCFLRFAQQYTFNNKNIVEFNAPGLGFANVAATGNLPSVTFIDPHFIELPPDGNCDGPPADVAQGQLLVKSVVESVIASPTWEKTMLIITYDEHGGFFDHVPPPPAAQVAPGLPSTHGLRVPAFVISPWVAAGSAFGHDAAGAGTSSQYFDHTSIMKTIAARFLSSDPNLKPPFLGPRYAAANVLSSVLGTQIRKGLFLPFIPYNFTYTASQKHLDVEGAAVAPGTPLWQYDPNGTNAQDFSFEDAGGGYYYIRTHTGNLYVTADSVPAYSTQTIGIKQDVKYPPGGANNPDLQRWGLTSYPVEASTHGQWATLHTAAHPDMLLHPANDSPASETIVILETLPQTTLSLSSKYAWLITSPLLGGSGDAGPKPPGTPVVVSPTAVTFPTQHVGTTSTELTATISTNTSLTISAIALLTDTGTPNVDYSCSPLPGSPPPGGDITIAANAHLVFYVWFHPTAVGTRNGSLQITHSAAGSPLIIPLSGIADNQPIPILKVSPGSLSFDPKKLTDHTLTLTNAGAAPLTISSIVVSDPNYSISNTCGVGPGAATLQPAQTCTVNVVCHFNGPGGTSSLVITHNAAGSPTTIDLNATSKTGWNP